MDGALKINRIFLPRECIDLTYEHMRKAGAQGLEGAALFFGQSKDAEFRIRYAVIPSQKALSIEEGLLYSIPPEEIYRINRWMYQKNLEMIAQIHSHPGRAYHSPTDDAYAIVTRIGGLSIVVPNFAKDEPAVSDWAVYRLVGQQQWEELSEGEKSEQIQIT